MKTSKILLQLTIAMIPIFYLLSIWNSLAVSLPMHFNLNNEPDRFGSKAELLFSQLLLVAINIGVAQLVANVHKLDPKKKIQANNNIAKKISWISLVFISMVGIYIIYSISSYNPIEKNKISPKVILVGVSIMFMLIGNFMNSVKPNYFIGFRTPWALENEENWRKTHRLGSKIWFFGGLIMAIILIILPESFMLYVMIFELLLLVILPYAYSYRIFKHSK